MRHSMLPLFVAYLFFSIANLISSWHKPVHHEKINSENNGAVSYVNCPAGCEHGCPAGGQYMVNQGLGTFTLICNKP